MMPRTQRQERAMRQRSLFQEPSPEVWEKLPPEVRLEAAKALSRLLQGSVLAENEPLGGKGAHDER